MAMKGYICMAMYGSLGLCRVIYGYVWPCMAMWAM